MKRLIHILFLGLMAMTAMAQLSSNPDKFLGNITTDYIIDYGNEKFYTLWNQITPENETKWDQIEGNRGSFNWNRVDAINNYAKQHNFPFKFHTLIWGSQYPQWINNLSASEQLKAITEWMDAIKGKYPDLAIIDVVNEAIVGHAPAPYKNALGGDGKTGYDWIIKAFEMAHERWPDAILVYNDYNTFRWQKTEFIDLVRTIRDAGAPVDAYGCQSHDVTDMDFSEFKSAMDEIQNALKMPMYSTEYDIGTEDDNLQLQRYQKQIPYMWESDYCAGITLWGYIYGHTWTTNGNSGIIKEDGQYRPAMDWLRDYMVSDAAKNAKSPFPGMKKDLSLYVKPASLSATVNEALPITITAQPRKNSGKTVEKVELYVNNKLYETSTSTLTSIEYTPTAIGKHDLKAVVTTTDGKTYERLSSFTAYKAREPYNGVIAELPGTIEGENFDSGAEGIASHDSDSQNQGSGASYRSDAGSVDIESLGNNKYAIGWTHAGEWLEYTVNVAEAGLYEYDIYVSSQNGGGAFSFALSEVGGLTDLTGTVNVVKTGDWSTYKVQHGRFTRELAAGKQRLRFIVERGDLLFNFDKIVLKRVDVDNSMSISVNASPASATVDENTTLTVSASSSTSTISNVKIYADQVLLKTLTGASYETTYKPTAKGTVNITAIATDTDGRQSKIATYALKVNNKRAAYKSVNLPGTLEFEDFDTGGEGLTFHDSDSNDEGDADYRTDGEGVDIVKGNGGSAIGYTAANEWLEYTVNVTKAGEYRFEAVVSSGVESSSFSLSLNTGNGLEDLTGTIAVPSAGQNDWDTYSTVTGTLLKPLEAGQQIIRVNIKGSSCNLDKITFRTVQVVPRKPFNDVATELPGTLEVENFDEGGEGVAFHDDDSENEGSDKYRQDGEGVDIVGVGDNNYGIGYTLTDEWLEYTVDVKEAGNYRFEALAASGLDNSSFSLSLNTGSELKKLTGTVVVPNTDSWNTYSTVAGTLNMPLEEGRQIIRLTITGAYCNLDKIIFKSLKGDVNSDGNVDELDVPELADIVLGLANTGANLDLGHTPFCNMELPGTIEAENFDNDAYSDTDEQDRGKPEYKPAYRTSSVDIYGTSDGGYAIGYTPDGEWLEYAVDAKEDGIYSFEAIVSSGYDTSSFSLSLHTKDDVLTPLTGEVPVTSGGDWDTYTTSVGRLLVPLQKGRQVIRLTITGGWCNIDKIKFTHVAGTSRGDLNGDGVVDIVDIAKLIDIIKNQNH